MRQSPRLALMQMGSTARLERRTKEQLSTRVGCPSIALGSIIGTTLPRLAARIFGCDKNSYGIGSRY